MSIKAACFVSLVLCATGSLGVQTGREFEASPLSLKLTFERQDFTLGEPIVGYLTVKNTGSTARAIPAELQPEYGRCRFDIATGSQQPERFLPWIAKDSDEVRTLAPGSEMSSVIKLFYGARGWTFKSPGAYTVATKCLGASAPLVVLHISVPESSADRAGAGIALGEEQVGLFMLVDGADNLRGAVDALNKILASEPQSVLAGYARADLGLNAGKRFVDISTRQVREPDLEKAVRYLEASTKVLLDRKAFYYVSKVTLTLRASYRALGRISDLARLETPPPSWSALSALFSASVHDAVSKELASKSLAGIK